MSLTVASKTLNVKFLKIGEQIYFQALSGQCGFMAANMYAKSIFGEDALANMSIEKPLNKPDAPVVGHIRIRAKSQGMALSLGDKISSTQKGPQSKVVQAA